MDNPESGKHEPDAARGTGERLIPRAFDPETLSGISFIDGRSNRKMRYVYPDAGHWCAGWLVVQNPSGEWMTLRKATDADISLISEAVIRAHHGE